MLEIGSGLTPGMSRFVSTSEASFDQLRNDRLTPARGLRRDTFGARCQFLVADEGHPPVDRPGLLDLSLGPRLKFQAMRTR